MERKMCRMCGKGLPEKEMFKKINEDNEVYYLCCQICYEQFTGKPLSGNPGFEFK